MFTIRTAIAPLNADPRVSSPLTSQLLHGEVVDVLERRGDWLRVRGADGYEGWLHVGYTMPCSGHEATWDVSLGCTVRTPSAVLRALPLGARVAPDDAVLDGEVIPFDSLATHFPRQPLAIAASATRLFSGAPYVWGGISPWGVDCSGLVQRVFGLHGVRLPRDAWQQAEAIQAAPDHALDALAPGELAFFSDREDRRITHVGIGVGNRQMVHSSLTRGGVAVERLDSSDAYVERLRGQVVARGRVG